MIPFCVSVCSTVPVRYGLGSVLDDNPEKFSYFRLGSGDKDTSGSRMTLPVPPGVYDRGPLPCQVVLVCVSDESDFLLLYTFPSEFFFFFV